MRRFKVLIASIAFMNFAGPLSAAAYQQEPIPNPNDIRVLLVDPTPEGDEVTIKILFPERGELKKEKPEVSLRLEGFPLRTYSEFPRAREVLNHIKINRNKKGQGLHVFVDNEPYFIENEATNALQEQELYYVQELEFYIPFDLKSGQHIVRIFPARSYGESLKGDGCFATRMFYTHAKTPKLDVDLDKPYLTYNEPQGEFNYDKNKPLLLDFYLTNVRLSNDGYKVRLTIDGNVQRTLTKWTPYYVYGLKAGKHTFKLELLNEANTLEPGAFNSVERTITIR